MFSKVVVESNNAKAKPSSRALARRSGANAPALETAEGIKKALATYAIVAWRLLWLTYQARQNPELPCDTILETHEWQSLYCHFHGSPPTGEKPPSIKQAVNWIAQLGGFLARRHDGLPGVKTLWRGLQRLHDIASTWKLLHSSPHPNL